MALVKKESILTSRLKRRTRKIKSSTIKAHLREFGDHTTLHGIHYVSEEGSHLLERLFWIIAIMICAVFCGLEVSKLLYRWQNSPVIISIAPRSTSVTSIPYPALTICPENKVKRTFVDMKQNLTKMKQQLNGTIHFESEEQKLYIEAISLICLKKYKLFSTELLKSNVKPKREHMNAIAKKISPTIEDIFEACYLNSKEIECKKLFRPIMLFYGLCFTFNTLYDQDLYNENVDEFALTYGNNMIEQSTWNPELGYLSSHNTRGEFPHRETRSRSGLQVILKSVPEDLQDVCTTRDADTFRITVQAPHVLPDSKIGKTVHASPGVETVIALRPTIKTTAPELRSSSYTPKIRGCFFPEERKLRIFKEYTLDNCILECLNDFLRQNCGCQMYYLPSKKAENMSFCPMMHSTIPNCRGFKDSSRKLLEQDIEGQIDLLGEDSPCECLPSCSDIKYQFHSSHEVYKSIHSGDEENITRSSNHAIVNMYFESPTFFGKLRSELYGITDLIASCGGLLGLFTGFSLITAIEIFYFTTLRLFCKIKRNHTNHIAQQDGVIKRNGK